MDDLPKLLGFVMLAGLIECFLVAIVLAGISEAIWKTKLRWQDILGLGCAISVLAVAAFFIWYPYGRPLLWLCVILETISLVHVYCESVRDETIGRPWLHVIMVMVVLWPLSYLLWVLWWPGSLRQAVFGSDKDKAQRWARRLIESKRRNKAPNHEMHRIG
jgi:hypothetical protein